MGTAKMTGKVWGALMLLIPLFLFGLAMHSIAKH
jgi:hypothetical protein